MLCYIDTYMYIILYNIYNTYIHIIDVCVHTYIFIRLLEIKAMSQEKKSALRICSYVFQSYIYPKRFANRPYNSQEPSCNTKMCCLRKG